jgi:hypothetical protein
MMQYYSFPMNISEAVERALDNAAPIELTNQEWVSPRTLCPVIAHDIPTRGHHGFPVRFPDRDEVVYPSYYVLVDSLDGLDLAVNEYHHQLHIPPDHHQIERELIHESQHRKAAESLGAIGSFYTLKISRNIPLKVTAWMVGHATAGLTTTKAGVAAIAAHPEWLSKSDNAQLHEIGYRNVHHVKKVGRRYDYPVPLSAK